MGRLHEIARNGKDAGAIKTILAKGATIDEKDNVSGPCQTCQFTPRTYTATHHIPGRRECLAWSSRLVTRLLPGAELGVGISVPGSAVHSSLRRSSSGQSRLGLWVQRCASVKRSGI